ncbi:alanine--tRNA ligase [Streptomyces tanashiensis]
MRDAPGPTAGQAGSENQPGRGRFEFGSSNGGPGAVLTDDER